VEIKRSEFEGTPLEIGCEVFNKICMAIVRNAETKLQATPQQVAQLYSGFISACLGSMTADFGQELGARIAQTNLDAFQRCDLGVEARKQ
jgi:hypothetical protein